MDEPAYTSSEFHDDVHKQLVNTTLAIISDAKLEWSQVAPFLAAGRTLCRDDVRLNSHLSLHGLEYEGAELVPAEEAFLAMSVRDREDGVEWLSQTWWLSDIALSDASPDRVRSAIVGLEKTLAHLNEWLAAHEASSGEAEAPPLT